MSARFYADLKRTLSAERLTGYRAPGSREQIARYLWNMALCESLYPVLQGLEVALRNSIHEAATAAFGTPWWFDGTGPLQLRGYRVYRNKKGYWVHNYEAAKVEYARERVARSGKPLTPGRVIAELTFGFWTSLFDRHYVRKGMLWPELLAPVFPHFTTGRTIKTVRRRMESVRNLRNRVFHHEPVWHWDDLQNQYKEAYEAVAWMCSSTHRLISSVDRFPHVYTSGYNEYCTRLDDILTSRPVES